MEEIKKTHKDRECLHCIRFFECEGKPLETKTCVRFQERDGMNGNIQNGPT